MNYASLMLGAIMLFALVYYILYGKKKYKGPVIELVDVDVILGGPVGGHTV